MPAATPSPLSRPAAADPARCPASGDAGHTVGWNTVAAIARGPVPPRQAFRLCREAGCEVVYYGDAGAVLRTADLGVEPGFKGGGGLLCYCFLHHRDDLERELAADGRSEILESIERQVRAGNCACEVRNPSGKCCLGEVRRASGDRETRTEIEP